MTNYPEYPDRDPPGPLFDIGACLAVACLFLGAFWLVCLLVRDWMYVALEWFQRVGKGG